MAKKPKDEAAEPAAARVVEMGTVCELDGNGVLVGKRAVPVAALKNYTPKANEVVRFEAVDLPLGRYTWNGFQFAPKRNDVSTAIQSQPDLIKGIMRGLEAIRDGKPLPQETLDSIDWYNNSFDGRRG